MTITEPRQLLPEDLLDGYYETGEIATLTGRIVKPWFMGPAAFHLDDIGPPLSKLCRYAGQIPTFYSVAEHCCWVYEEMREAGIGEEDVLRAGFLHDASEAYLVDMPAPVKNLPAMKPYRDAEDRLQDALGQRYGFDLFDYETAQVVKRYDKAAYVFETKFVRTGIVSGLSPAEALSDWRGIATNLGLDVL